MERETKERLVLAGGLLAFVTTIFVGGVVAGRYSKKPAEKEEEETSPPTTPVEEAAPAEKILQEAVPRRSWKRRGLFGFFTVTALTVIFLAASKKEGAVKKPYH